ncbi:MAG TPA: autotransporter-associated beta strand repeat-containing protein [Verrucomicrobiae bacterium]|jgi:autotransporter-associated beta strand protein
MKLTTACKKVAGRALAVILLGAGVQSSLADNGIWTNDASGNWGDAINWQGGVVADGSGFIADFSTIDITANRTVTLDAAHTLSTLNFGDAGAVPDFNWLLTGPGVLTLGASPIINVVNQTATIGVSLAGTTGFSKNGNGHLVLTGTNTYTGNTTINTGKVTYSGSGSSSGTAGYNLLVGGATGRAVLNFNSSGTLSFATGANSQLFYVGGNGGGSDTGVGAVYQTAGLVNFGNSGGNYLTLGAVGGASYGSYNLSGGTLTIPGGAGTRIGYGGLGSYVQTGGTLNCGRYFAIGGNGATGNGVATFSGGTITVSSSYRFLIPDAASATAVMNVGTEAGGTASITTLSTTCVAMENSASGNGTLNLNSGALILGGPITRVNTSGGSATLNLNGGVIRAGGNNITLINANLGSAKVYNGGVTFDSQANTATVAASLAATMGNGIYPSSGILTVASGGGAGYIGAPLVAISGGSGTGATAIANIASGVISGVTVTCPGQNYQAGDSLTFTFNGGGATNAATPYTYVLQAADVAANATGGLIKLGSGKLILSATNSYSGTTAIGAGTLDVKADGGLGNGNVVVGSGTTLILETGLTNGYIAASANLVISGGGVVNLNFSGANTINGLSLDGGATYMAPGTYGSSSSGAPNVDDTHFTGTGTVVVTTTPVVPLNVALASSINPSVYGQSVTFTATVTTSGGGTPSGSVTFKDGATTLATVTLDGTGKGTLATNGLSIGSHSITAVYDTTVSPILSQVVNTPTDIWSGSVNGVWDINTTSNWLALGSATAYAEGNIVQFDDAASGSTSVALNVPVNPLSVTVSNRAKDYSIAGTGGISGGTGLAKDGNRSLTISVANSYTGTTIFSNGVVTYTSGSANSGNGSLLVGAYNGNAVMNVNTTNALSFNGTLAVGGNLGDTADSGVGVINQYSGTFNSGGGGDGYIEIGTGGANTYGVYNLAGGTLNTPNTSGLRIGAQGTGIFNQSGGVLNCNRYFALGTQSANNNIGGIGIATFTGGSALFSSAYRIIVGDKPGGTAVFNLGTEASGTAVLTNLYNNAGNGGMELLDNAAASSGTLNLNSGVLQVGGAIYINSVAGGAAAINLNGATLQAGANNINLIAEFSSELIGNYGGNVFARGIVVDSQTNTCSINADLVVMGGNGIYPAVGKLTVTDGGTGYLGVPMVTVYGGSGSGAMAVAEITNGQIVSVSLTCPGQYYQAGDVLDFQFTGGGPTTPAADFLYTLQAGDVQLNSNGGLTKIGSGTLYLTSANDNYTGTTTVSNGTLAISGILSGGGQVNVMGGMLGGAGGIVYGPVSISGGGALTAGITNVGTFTVNNTVTLAPGAAYFAKIDKGLAVQDLLQGVSTLTYGGTLNVTNLSGTLALNDSFKLFDAASYQGGFTAVNPSIPGPGLAWDTTQLTVNGTLAIIAGNPVNPNPTNIVVTVTGGGLNISWPIDHTGWTLQVQTNSLSTGLSNNWFDVAGSTTTNALTIPINPSSGSEFFRLKYVP